MTREDVEILNKQRVFSGYFGIDRYRLQHKLYDGGVRAELEREVFERGHVVAVLPLDIERERVVLIEQFRPGAYAAGLDPWLLECVAGIIEPGESVERVARREVREETGCDTGRIEQIARFMSSPGACSETVTLFWTEVDSECAQGIHGLADEGEDIRVCVMPIADAWAAAEDGRIVNAKTIIALQWLALNFATLN